MTPEQAQQLHAKLGATGCLDPILDDALTTIASLQTMNQPQHLPEPNDPNVFVPNGKGWLPGGPHGPSVWTAPGGTVMVQRIEPGDLTPEEAREVANALYAAANYSEGKQ